MVDNRSKLAHPVEAFHRLSLRIHAVHHIDLGQICVVHDLPLSSKITQGFLLTQNSDDLCQKLGD